MKWIERYLKTSGIFLGAMLIFTLLLSILQYFNILSGTVSLILTFIFMIGLFFFFGMQFGKTTDQKGYLEGLKIGAIFSLVVFLLNLFFFTSPFKLTRILYYGLLILASVVGSMIGINKKK